MSRDPSAGRAAAGTPRHPLQLADRDMAAARAGALWVLLAAAAAPVVGAALFIILRICP